MKTRIRSSRTTRTSSSTVVGGRGGGRRRERGVGGRGQPGGQPGGREDKDDEDETRNRSRSRSRNWSGAGSGNFKNGQPCGKGRSCAKFYNAWLNIANHVREMFHTGSKLLIF